MYTEADAAGIGIVEKNLRGRNKGLYGDGLIILDKRISTTIEKACILAEELGHYHTSAGNILDQKDIRNRKQELRARQWAYQCMIPLDRIVQAHHARVKGRYEIAEYLNVTEEFLQSAIDRYRDKYGLFATYNEKYIICFDSLGVLELFA
ncbi:ImmA/IrrE family metallo-endopeptidase [Paenibacillus sp. 28ISP30-2]|nr:ImmA/IrrE family metallo-endopeptidase [Paenibacillus sp. 28ISP30-2]